MGVRIAAAVEVASLDFWLSVVPTVIFRQIEDGRGEMRAPMRTMSALLFGVIAAASVVVEPARGQAQLPVGQVRILVPFAAGGPTDVIMRILGDFLGKRWAGP